jgi:hypothetical protein
LAYDVRFSAFKSDTILTEKFATNDVRKMKLYTASAIAKELGISTSEINAMQKAGAIDYEQGKLYALKPAAKGAVAFYKGKSTGDQALDYSTERAMLMRTKRIAAEHELDLQEGKLHEAGDVAKIVTDMLLNFRARIMGVPAKLAPKIAKEHDEGQVYEMLKEAMDDALNELSDYNALFGKGEDE